MRGLGLEALAIEDGPDEGNTIWPAYAEPLPIGSAADAQYAESLRLELDRHTERSYREIFAECGGGDDFDFVFGPWANQNRLFAMDMFPLLKGELFAQPWGSQMRLLDVAPGGGAGTALLASLFRDAAFGYTIACEGLEPSAHWADLYPILHRNVTARNETLFDVPDGSYDIVTASHMIQRLSRQEATAAIRKMARIARRFAIVVGPWKEAQPLCPGHDFSLDVDLIAEVKPDNVAIFRSLGWNNPFADAALLQCVGMVFRRGPAKNGAGA